MSERKNWPVAVSVRFSVVADGAKLDELRNAGITEIELSSGDLRPFFEYDFFEKSVEIVEFAKAHGVNISSVHLPFVPFTMIDGTYSENDLFTVKLQSMIMKAAAAAGIKIAVIHPSGEPYKEEERSARLECGCKVIAALTENAKKLGMQLALENLPRTCLCRDHVEMLYFLERIPDLKVCFDMNHNLSEDNEDYIRAVADRIITLHVSDYDFVDERHWLPGKGKVDWKRMIDVLEDVDYEGRFLYEIDWDDLTFADVAENYKQLMSL